MGKKDADRFMENEKDGRNEANDELIEKKLREIRDQQDAQRGTVIDGN